MTSLNTQLWELISNYKMPADASGLPFTDQLMAQNSISRETADVAIIEYHKFMYLCATRDKRNVPSKAVDLVWHLHMQHSRDYWDGFCKILGKPVHHNPGGQGAGHLEDYKATVEAYRELFGIPPKGIWKQSNKGGTLLTLILLMVTVWFSIDQFWQSKVPALMVLYILFLLYMFVSTLNELTPKGEFSFVFGNKDPFSDDDAGDCGSGCGGCGD